jgi:cytochrome c556
MGVMLRTDTYNADKFLAFAGDLVARRDAPWPHFGPDTHYPPTKATAQVWQQPEKFAQDKNAFIAATNTLLAAAQTKDRQQVAAPYQAVHDTCRNCHQTFKQR